MADDKLYIIRQLQINEFLQQPAQQTRLIKILIQTLNDLGYRQSAHALQKQSNVKYFNKDLEQLEQLLESGKPLGTLQQGLLSKLFENREQLAKDKANLLFLELNLERLAHPKGQNLLETTEEQERRRQFDKQALEAFKMFEQTQPKTDGVKQMVGTMACQMMFAERPFHSIDSKKVIRQLMELSDVSGIERHCMENIIKFYLENRKSYACYTPTQLYEFLSLDNVTPTTETLPHKLICSISFPLHCEIEWVSFNASGTKFLTVGTNLQLKMSDLCVWNLKALASTTQFSSDFEANTEQCDRIGVSEMIEGVCWNYEEGTEQLIATISRESITLWNHLKTNKLIKLKNIKIADGLCCRFMPGTGLLYTGGINDHHLRIWIPSGEQLDNYKTGLIRNIVFNPLGSKLYIMSASEYKLKMIDTAELEVLAEKKHQMPLLDCMVCQNQNVLVTTHNQLLLLHKDTLATIRGFVLDVGPKQNFSYTYVKCSGPWFVTNQNGSFKGVNKQTNGQFYKWNSFQTNCPFDITTKPYQNIVMVSGFNKKVNLWAYGQNKDLAAEIVHPSDGIFSELERLDDSSAWDNSSNQDMVDLAQDL